ncbi:transketolase [compost metagenome]
MNGLEEAKAHTGKGKPVCILLKTEMGAGVSFMMGSHEWHGIAPSDAQLDIALTELVTTGTIGDY